LEFKNSFSVEGSPAEVIAVFADTPLVASFLPGASVGEQREDGSYPGQLVVAFGPKRLSFKGSLVNEAQSGALTGKLTGQASADVRGAKMAVTLDYKLSPVAEGTQVDTVSEAELTGILAEFARTGGAVVTEALLEQFAQRFSAHMRALRAPAANGIPPIVGSLAAAEVAANLPTPSGAVKPLSGFVLLLRILKSMFANKRGKS
jgi:carbon monoxide dehydrogenase subunit G